ncbi:MAG: aspartate aminotransferase family protein [Rhodobacteraceae bacterium]|nr:aspartate aminotransferase family protein [Paracoccaceae bacterium]
MNRPITEELRALDAAHHMHPFSDNRQLPKDGVRIITQAKGVMIWDSDGNRYIDGMSSLWNVNIGHGRPEIAEAVAAQFREVEFFNLFYKTSNVPAIRLAEKLAAIAPEGFEHVMFTNGGSESIDTAFRMVRTYWAMQGRPEKFHVIARRNAYHGSTVAGASLGGMTPMHEQGGLPIPGISHIAQPYWWGEGGDMSPDEFGIWAARELAREIDRLGENRIAAFFAEPIQGAGGVIIPPRTYWPEVQRILSEREILFVSDEVICGYGRLGTWFGCEFFGTKPDLMTTAKGLSSGYLPIGAVLVGKRVADVFYGLGGEFNHGFTYSGHPVCCAAALKNIEIIESERLVERVRDHIGPYMKQKWTALADHPLVGEAEMEGLIGAIPLTPDKAARGKWAEVGEVGTICRNHSFQNGLVMRAVGDRMVIAPPLTITEAEVDELVDIARRTLDDTARTLKDKGLI